MDQTQLELIWNNISLNKSIDNANFFPLVNIGVALDFFDISHNLKNKILNKNISNFIIHKKPNFKDLTNEDLEFLRNCVYHNVFCDETFLWAETLMRFCEVRYNSLKKRAKQKCQNLLTAKLLMLHLSSFLLDQAISQHDVRYLNTVLKLCDIKWIFNPNQLQKNVSKNQQISSCDLLEFRVMLLTEYAFNKICVEIN